MWSARKQANVSVLSNNRQAWINTLRDQIAEFISIGAQFHSGDWSARGREAFDDKFERLVFIESKIKLLLNPNEEDHTRLVSLLERARNTLGNHGADSEGRRFPEWAELYQEFVPLAQEILKREWERVKKQE